MRAVGIGRDDLADAVERLRRHRLVHQPADRLADEPPARPEDVERDERGEDRVEDGQPVATRQRAGRRGRRPR